MKVVSLQLSISTIIVTLIILLHNVQGMQTNFEVWKESDGAVIKTTKECELKIDEKGELTNLMIESLILESAGKLEAEIQIFGHNEENGEWKNKEIVCIYIPFVINDDDLRLFQQQREMITINQPSISNLQ